MSLNNILQVLFLGNEILFWLTVPGLLWRGLLWSNVALARRPVRIWLRSWVYRSLRVNSISFVTKLFYWALLILLVHHWLLSRSRTTAMGPSLICSFRFFNRCSEFTWSIPVVWVDFLADCFKYPTIPVWAVRTQLIKDFRYFVFWAGFPVNLLKTIAFVAAELPRPDYLTVSCGTSAWFQDIDFNLKKSWLGF